MAEKRYYWLKLENTFFNDPRIKKLRKIAGGDTYTCIYLKLMLYSLQSNAIIFFERIEKTLEEELALKLDEDVTNLKVLLAFLHANALIEVSEEATDGFLLHDVEKRTGSEAWSTKRVRDHRQAKKLLHCNKNETDMKQLETKRNEEIDKEKELEKDSLSKSLFHKKRFTNFKDFRAYVIKEYSSKNICDGLNELGYYAHTLISLSGTGLICTNGSQADKKSAEEVWGYLFKNQHLVGSFSYQAN